MLEQNQLILEVRYNDSRKLYSESLSLHKDYTHIGMPLEFAKAVQKGVMDYFENSNTIPFGRLIINMAANCDAGSSIKIFTCTTKILLEILLRKT